MVRKLVLHAGDPHHVPADEATVIAALEQAGLLGAPLPGAVAAWSAGEEFLSLVTFLGCSPHVDLVPADDAQRERGSFCHVRWQAGDASRFRPAPGTLRPRCKECRAPVLGWEPLVAAWQAGDAAASASCERCGAGLRAPELNWRQSAGFGRWFLEIWNIHPHEAVPSEALMAALESAVGARCGYFYE